jgi:carbonic anhydrase
MKKDRKNRNVAKYLLSGHAHFRSEYFAGESAYLRHLAATGQTPRAMYVGCSDSRVIPELLTSSRPGELFVVRNVGNLIPPFGHHYVSVGAAMEFAIERLGVRHLIVCGHDGCGGVRAALDGVERVADLPSLHQWLAAAVPAAERARGLGLDDEDTFRAAVETNVLYQMDNVITYPSVERALRDNRLSLHGWVYDLAEGALRVFDVAREEFVPSDQV